jgi:2-polyprenyl-3-methyl-5-hydroxy-6-metoxy-1,4-benzoquinol methylase
MSYENTTGFTKNFSLPRQLVNREAYILQKCLGKRVLHIGCVDYGSSDHWASIVERRGWLHSKIEKVAAELVGIDNAAEAVQLAISHYGFQNIYVADAQHLETLKKGTFDVVVAGEVLEHLPSPGSFLNSAHTVLKQDGSCIVTTTNAYCLRRFLRIPFGKESIHVDHLAYFSHRTLRHLAEVCGYHVVEQCSYRIPNRKPLLPYLVERVASWVSPNLCEGIICQMKRVRNL